MEKLESIFVKMKIVSTPLDTLEKLANDVLRKEIEDDIWKYSKFESISKLKGDKSGEVGELLIREHCKNGDIDHVYNKGINSKDGTYDMMISGKKAEIKTARLGKHGTFQHESLRLDGYDVLFFIDITPEYYYITILPKFDLKIKSKLLNKTPHLRKGTTDVYKLDFTELLLRSLDTSGYTIIVDEYTTSDEVSDFITKSLGKLAMD